MYVCMYVCIYIYMPIYTHIYTHIIYIYIHTHTSIYVNEASEGRQGGHMRSRAYAIRAPSGRQIRRFVVCSSGAHLSLLYKVILHEETKNIYIYI